MKEKEKEAMHIKKNDTIGNDIYEIFAFYVSGFVVNFGMQMNGHLYCHKL